MKNKINGVFLLKLRYLYLAILFYFYIILHYLIILSYILIPQFSHEVQQATRKPEPSVFATLILVVFLTNRILCLAILFFDRKGNTNLV